LFSFTFTWRVNSSSLISLLEPFVDSCSGNALDFYSGSIAFESRSGYVTQFSCTSSASAREGIFFVNYCTTVTWRKEFVLSFVLSTSINCTCNLSNLVRYLKTFIVDNYFLSN
jgi:hypothetical protein